jgi:hypothetical protein
MYKYHKTYRKSSRICECENRSLLLKGRQRGQKSVLTALGWVNPRQSSETAVTVLTVRMARKSMSITASFAGVITNRYADTGAQSEAATRLNRTVQLGQSDPLISLITLFTTSPSILALI